MKAGRLLFMAVGAGLTATGQPVAPVILTRQTGDSHRYAVTDRDPYTGVRTYWQHMAGAGRREIVVATAANLKTLRKTYARAADAEQPHGLKYRLYYGRPGQRLIGYDNERGKGDHKHIEDEEFSYTFTTVDQLIRDFLADVARLRGGP